MNRRRRRVLRSSGCTAARSSAVRSTWPKPTRHSGCSPAPVSRRSPSTTGWRPGRAAKPSAAPPRYGSRSRWMTAPPPGNLVDWALGAVMNCPNARAAVEIGALLLAGNLLRLTARGHLAREMVTATRIAVAAAFLLGSDASYIAGTDLIVDGGVSAASRTAPPSWSVQVAPRPERHGSTFAGLFTEPGSGRGALQRRAADFQRLRSRGGFRLVPGSPSGPGRQTRIGRGNEYQASRARRPGDGRRQRDW